MNAPEKIRLTDYSHGGGCGCKIAPAVLSEILAATPIRGLPKDLLVGLETADDAAVYRLNDTPAIVATTDFFTPIVDEPFDFGRIAATNALSDVYAMGGKPILALAIVGMPVDRLPAETIGAILGGGGGGGGLRQGRGPGRRRPLHRQRGAHLRPGGPGPGRSRPGADQQGRPAR